MGSVKQWLTILGAILGGIGGYMVAGIGGAILGSVIGSLVTLILANFFAGVVIPSFITAAILVAIISLTTSMWNIGG